MENKNDSDVFNQKLFLQEDKYVDFKSLKIYCGTFNVKLNAFNLIKLNFIKLD